MCLSDICKTKRREENWKEGETVSVMAQTRHLAAKSDTVQHPHSRVLIRLSEDKRDKYTVRHKENKKEGEIINYHYTDLTLFISIILSGSVLPEFGS